MLIEVSKQTLELIADQNTLEQNGLNILEHSLTEASDKVALSYIPQESLEAYPEMHHTFHWGLTNRIARMGHMNEKLSLLVHSTDSPEQTLAFNHFDKAREAFSREDDTTALEEIEKAVYGNQTSSGFKSEWRFYQLQGIIRLGFYDCNLKAVDLKKAEESFKHVVAFAHTDFPSDTALAYLCISWANYCQGKFDEAISFAGKAVEMNQNLTEAYFMLAKYNMAAKQIEPAIHLLNNVINKHGFYALKAAGDGDFQVYESELRDCLSSIKSEKFANLSKRISDDMNAMKAHKVPSELQEIVDRFSTEKPLLELSNAEKEWNNFKIKPVFMSKAIEKLKFEHDVTVKVMEPYRERVVVKPGNWLRKEETKFITKNRLVEKKKKNKYEIDIFRDIFMFFTGKVLAEYDMVLVEGSKFSMGDTNSVGRSDEKPIHEVELNSFLISKIQVTQKIWNLATESNPSNFHGFDLPVEHISWYECIEFCNNLSLLAGFTPCYTIDKNNPDPNNVNKNDSMKWTVTCNWEADGYRLPTEAEWEFAAKGGLNSNFYNFSGSDNEYDVAWHKDNSGYKTQNVGQKKPNELGLYDMSGNVWEWCWDWYDAYSSEPQANPKGAENGSYRVLRGGSWADSRNYERVAGRGKENATGKYTSIGVRIVRGYFKK